MKARKFRAWITAEFLICLFYLHEAFNSTSDNAAFLFYLGMTVAFLANFLEHLKNPEKLARIGMTIPEIYQDFRKTETSPPQFVYVLRYLFVALLIIAAYFKFFAH